MNNKALVVPDVARKHQPKYKLEIILKVFPGLCEWLKDLSRYRKLEDWLFVSDYKNTDKEISIGLQFYTKDHCYFLRAVLPRKGYADGYLGCISQTRKSRAGEDWQRGNDLSDGSYSKETWQWIKNDILSYELVKVVRNSSDK